MTPKKASPPTFWDEYKEAIRLPARYLLRDATIGVINLSIIAVFLLILRSFEFMGVPAWFTRNYERLDLFFALINMVILGFDFTFKLLLVGVKGFKDERAV